MDEISSNDFVPRRPSHVSFYDVSTVFTPSVSQGGQPERTGSS